MIDYDIIINEGNDILGMDKTITLKRKPHLLSSQRLLQRIYDKNPLVPKQVTKGVIDFLFDVIVDELSNGRSVRLKRGNETQLRFSPEVRIKGGNINLKRAKELDPSVTDITPENAAALVRKAGTYIRVKVRCDKRMTQKLQDTKSIPDNSETQVIIKKKVTSKQTTCKSTAQKDV